MKIETKFDVNNLVRRKFDTNSKNVKQGLEVMEVIAQTCYAGTQVFYLCKPIICQKEFAEKYSEKGEFTWVIGHGVHKEDNSSGWMKYREDELLELDKETIDIVLGNS